ncbi:hypothetical protein GGI09_006472 [Coemansia sp. S100]|nr:hypothetical protein GGI09_006472 [Coemansia sp. S100]
MASEHLRLAEYWANTSIAKAQDTQLSEIHSQLISANTVASSHAVQELYDQTTQALESLTLERHQLTANMQMARGQLDTALVLVSALDANIAQMEAALSQAESAVGLTLGGRLSQLARMTPGVPYLRQWSEKVPKVLNVNKYI